jgi:hypothetical protein
MGISKGMMKELGLSDSDVKKVQKKFKVANTWKPLLSTVCSRREAEKKWPLTKGTYERTEDGVKIFIKGRELKTHPKLPFIKDSENS